MTEKRNEVVSSLDMRKVMMVFSAFLLTSVLVVWIDLEFTAAGQQIAAYPEAQALIQKRSESEASDDAIAKETDDMIAEETNAVNAIERIGAQVVGKDQKTQASHFRHQESSANVDVMIHIFL